METDDEIRRTETGVSTNEHSRGVHLLTTSAQSMQYAMPVRQVHPEVICVVRNADLPAIANYGEFSGDSCASTANLFSRNHRFITGDCVCECVG